MSDENSNQESRWSQLRAELGRRLVEPLKSPVFVIYFVVVIVIIGGAGIWEILVRSATHKGEDLQFSISQATLSAIHTYLVAIAAAAAADAILRLGEANRALRFLGYVAVMAIVLIAVFNSVFVESMFLATLLGVGALVLWWVVNADNATLRDENPPPSASTGGDPRQPLQGDLAGLNA